MSGGHNPWGDHPVDLNMHLHAASNIVKTVSDKVGLNLHNQPNHPLQVPPPSRPIRVLLLQRLPGKKSSKSLLCLPQIIKSWIVRHFDQVHSDADGNNLFTVSRVHACSEEMRKSIPCEQKCASFPISWCVQTNVPSKQAEELHARRSNFQPVAVCGRPRSHRLNLTVFRRSPDSPRPCQQVCGIPQPPKAPPQNAARGNEAPCHDEAGVSEPILTSSIVSCKLIRMHFPLNQFVQISQRHVLRGRHSSIEVTHDSTPDDPSARRPQVPLLLSIYACFQQPP